ncbi:hypothetical protein OG216_01725 [Streptomycetaceae bacterium NBC_01309]
MAGSVVEELQGIVDGLVARERHSQLVRSLANVIEAAHADEEHIAFDNLCHLVEYYRIHLTPAEFTRISNLAEHLDSAYVLDETNLASYVAE